jgi:TIR domain
MTSDVAAADAGGPKAKARAIKLPTAQVSQTEASKTKIFISYSRKDMAFADRLEAALKEHAFEPLIDRTEIYAFEDWWKRIKALIARADTFIFVLSPDAVASSICAKEVEFAASLNKRFAPIVFRRVDDNQVPEALARLNFVFFDDESQFGQSVSRLCEALARISHTTDG